MKRHRRWTVLTAIMLIISLFATACGSGNQAGSGSDDQVVIGFSMDTLEEERWQRDRDLFVKKAEELGAKVNVQAANSDDAVQLAQVENLITQGVDVLVVVPHNAEAAAAIVDKAHEADIPVISYDRLIRNAEVDLYVSFDNERVGEMQAESITQEVPKGKYALIEGADTDNNAHLFKKGQMNVLKPLVEKGDIEIVYDQWTRDWRPEVALRNMENALTANKNEIDAVLAANDGTAGGVIRALDAQGLAGKVPVSGQDAELAACQRVVEGTQTMTVYKPIHLLAEKVAEVAVDMGKGKEPKPDSKVNNGKIDVPSILLDPIAVTKDNMMDTIIKDDFHKMEDVYKNVPKDQRPKQG
ncbi:D-xylose ABC transporter substrate-binding protein [Desmospora profundinema]|uniref:D-xylose transport system substrate-binding protein n=1 Tax=Desmospora profundinema TaxID=1571184 RepID=A0ABU1IPZ3_9BACL|nr:D-xylose ABC transporter substrate-binding protein [Desmospora profundinema]MDR6226864.1 D-xylose transport system substrate-binding protein [Desmospora profundinema]